MIKYMINLTVNAEIKKCTCYIFTLFLINYQIEVNIFLDCQINCLLASIKSHITKNRLEFSLNLFSCLRQMFRKMYSEDYCVNVFLFLHTCM